VREAEKRKKKEGERKVTADDFDELDDIGDVGDSLEAEVEAERKRGR
jgi:hypothetical protein